MTTQYRNCEIYYDPPPIPDRSVDYHWRHEDYDGPPDRRCGSCSSTEDCIKEIDEILEEAE